MKAKVIKKNFFLLLNVLFYLQKIFLSWLRERGQAKGDLVSLKPDSELLFCDNYSNRLDLKSSKTRTI